MKSQSLMVSLFRHIFSCKTRHEALKAKTDPPTSPHERVDISEGSVNSFTEHILIAFRKRLSVIFRKSIAEPTTVLALYAFAAAGSAICIGIAITTTRPPICAITGIDDGFYTALSQAFLQIFSLYCILVPFIRSQVIPAYRSWFWFCLILGTLAGVLAVVVYPFTWKASTALGFVAGVTQTIVTIQLVEGLHQAAQRDNLTPRSH